VITNWTHIILHHSATKDGPLLDFKGFRNYHVQTRGWRDVGYHAGIEMVNGVYECMYGRPLTMQGAHAPGFNKKALGIVFAGNYETDQFDIRMAEIAVYRIIRPWVETFNIPLANILPHSATKDTICPGQHFPVAELRDLI